MIDKETISKELLYRETEIERIKELIKNSQTITNVELNSIFELLEADTILIRKLFGMIYT